MRSHLQGAGTSPAPTHAEIPRSVRSCANQLPRRRVGWRSSGPRAIASAVGDLPVLAQVEPGTSARDCRARHREQRRAFAERPRGHRRHVLLPGIELHWQSPRFFAYFSTTGSEPGDPRRAAHRRAATTSASSGAPRRRSRSSRRLSLRWLARAARPARRLARAPRGGRLVLDPRCARGRTRCEAGRTASSSARSTRTRRSTRPAGCSSSSCARYPQTTRSACGPTLLDLDRGAARSSPTVGTTSSTSVDPVVGDRGRLRARAGVWLHVDAAYAGSVMICPELRWAFEGIERVDSLVVNPHKWLLTPQGCSALWSTPARGLPRHVQPRSRVPADARMTSSASASTGPSSDARSAR